MMDFGSMGLIGSADDYFDSADESRAIERIQLKLNDLNMKMNSMLKKEFPVFDYEDIAAIDLFACGILCNSCFMFPEEQREDFFANTIKMLKDMHIQYKKIPPPKH